MNGLKGKVAVVTGGANGIGAGVITRFANEGMNAVIADIDDKSGEALVEALADAPGEVIYVHTDISSRESVEALFEKTVEAFGRVDVLVNNAAYVHKSDFIAHFLEYEYETWEKTLAINLYGMFYCSKAAARLMAKQGDGGAIINMSSGGASRSHRQMIGYDTTKGGIEAATRSMSLDLAPLGIRVNTVVPGSIQVENDTNVGGDDDAPTPPDQVIPLQRRGTPEDIAGVVAFLASDDAAYVTGSRVFADGGMDAQLRTPSVDFPFDESILDNL